MSILGWLERIVFSLNPVLRGPLHLIQPDMQDLDKGVVCFSTKITDKTAMKEAAESHRLSNDDMEDYCLDRK